MVELLSVTRGKKCEKMRNKTCHFVFVASPLGPALRPKKLPTSFSEDEASNLRSWPDMILLSSGFIIRLRRWRCLSILLKTEAKPKSGQYLVQRRLCTVPCQSFSRWKRHSHRSQCHSLQIRVPLGLATNHLPHLKPLMISKARDNHKDSQDPRYERSADPSSLWGGARLGSCCRRFRS